MTGGWATAMEAAGATGLAPVADLVRGRSCDLRGVVFDDARGVLHLPLCDGRGGSRQSELIVRRIVEFSVAGADGVGWFEVGRVAYAADGGRLSIHSTGRLRFDLGVDAVDVALKVRRTA